MATPGSRHNQEFLRGHCLRRSTRAPPPPMIRLNRFRHNRLHTKQAAQDKHPRDDTLHLQRSLHSEQRCGRITFILVRMMRLGTTSSCPRARGVCCFPHSELQGNSRCFSSVCPRSVSLRAPRRSQRRPSTIAAPDMSKRRMDRSKVDNPAHAHHRCPHRRLCTHATQPRASAWQPHAPAVSFSLIPTYNEERCAR